MLKRKFIILVVVCLFLVVSSITYAESTEKSGEITIWSWDPNFNIPIMKEAAERYAKDNPKVTFEITDLAKADVEQKLHINLASGVTAGLPDIVLIEDYIGLDDGGLMRIMMQSAGKWYFDDKGNVNLSNNDALKEAVKTYKAIVDSDIIKKTSGWGEWVAAFNNSDTASVITGVWIIGSVKADEASSGKWKVATTPRLNIAGAVNASNLGGSSWYVLENSENKDLAIDFLNKIYAGDIDFYQKILTDRGAVGTYLPAQGGAAYSKEDEFFSGQKVYTDFSGWIKAIPVINYGIYTYEADAAIFAVMPDVYSGKISIEDALEKAEEQLKNQIKR